MSRSTSRLSSTIGLLGVVALAMSSLSAPAQAAAKAPPPASQLTVVERSDHRLAVRFAVPSAFYHPGAGSVVRLTGGRTPAASPTKGYAVPTDARHVATTGPGVLRAGTDYTLAVWIRDNGVYSKRISVTTRTLADTTKPDPVTALTARAGIGEGDGRVVLSWRNPVGDDLDHVRIVRNTKPTTTGGTVVNVAPGAQAYTDDALPASVKNEQGFTDAPLYYYVIAQDRAGNFARSYTSTSVVVGSRTLSGTYAGTKRFISLWGAPDDVVGQSRAIGTKSGDAIAGNTFSFRAPPGVYTVCDADNATTNGNDADPTATCFVVNPDGSTRTVPWPGLYDENVASPSIDVRNGDYTTIAFTAGADAGS